MDDAQSTGVTRQGRPTRSPRRCWHLPSLCCHRQPSSKNDADDDGDSTGACGCAACAKRRARPKTEPAVSDDSAPPDPTATRTRLQLGYVGDSMTDRHGVRTASVSDDTSPQPSLKLMPTTASNGDSVTTEERELVIEHCLQLSRKLSSSKEDEDSLPDRRDIDHQNGRIKVADGDGGEGKGVQDGWTAPDGGWGWMCVVGCCIMTVLLGGLNFGVIFVHMVEKLECSAMVGSLIGGLQHTLRVACGPIVSVLVRHSSHRSVTAVGALIFAGGWILCAFTTSTLLTLFGFSLLGGVGWSLVYFPSMVIISEYFDKRRGLAMGIANSGFGLGALALPPIMELLFTHYGYRGAFFILSGIILHHLISAALYRPIEEYWPIEKRQISVYKVNGHSNTSSSSTVDKMRKPAVKLLVENTHNEKYPKRHRHSRDRQISTDAGYEYLVEPTEELEKEKRETLTLTKPHSGSSSKNSRKRNSDERSLLRNSEKKNDPFSPCRSCRNAISMIDWELLIMPPFIGFVVSSFLLTGSQYSGQTLIVAHATTQGIESSKAVYLLSIVGGADLVGCVGSGIIYDIPSVRPVRSYVYMLTLLILGLAITGFAFCRSFAQFAVVTAAAGFLSGAVFTGIPIILVDLVGLERLPPAFGWTIFLHGISYLVGPMIAGYLKDVTGTYFVSYLVAGGCACTTGFIFLCGYRWKSTSKK